MAEQKKSTFKSMAEAVSRFKNRAEAAKEQGEMIAGEVMRTGMSAGASFAAGLVDERFGTADAETGIRIHRTNGAPTALLAGAALKVASGFGLLGKFQTVGFAAGDGAVSSASANWGRMAGARLRAKAEKVEQASTTPVAAPAPETKAA